MFWRELAQKKNFLLATPEFDLYSSSVKIEWWLVIIFFELNLNNKLFM